MGRSDEIGVECAVNFANSAEYSLPDQHAVGRWDFDALEMACHAVEDQYGREQSDRDHHQRLMIGPKSQDIALHFAAVDRREMYRDRENGEGIIGNEKQQEWKGIQARSREIEIGIQVQHPSPSEDGAEVNHQK